MLTMKGLVRLMVSSTAVVALLLVAGSDALARPKYLAVANAAYPELAKKKGNEGKLTCALCHPTTEKEKKFRNNYGAALGKHLEKKNEGDEAKIKEALKATEKDASATEGKTFGDLIGAGELPGTNEAVK